MANKIASSLGDNVGLGVIVVAGTTDVKFVVTKSTAAGLGSTNLSPSNGTNISMAPVPGLLPTDEVSLNVVESTFNSLENGTAATRLASKIIAINLRKNKDPFRVRGLTTKKIRFTMASSNPARDLCRYFEETLPATSALRWLSEGVFKVISGPTSITCETEHLTSFAALPDTSSGDNTGGDPNYYSSDRFLSNVIAPTIIAAVVLIVVVGVAVVIYRRQQDADAESEAKEIKSAPSGGETHNVLSGVRPSAEAWGTTTCEAE